MIFYVIGSLRNPEVLKFSNRLRGLGHEVFEDWMAAGPEADDKWMEYEKGRGHTFVQALEGHAAHHVFEYDRAHLDRCDAAILLMPAGKSGHLELGYVIGKGKPAFIVMDKEPERFDVMYRFANKVYASADAFFADNFPTDPRTAYTVWRDHFFGGRTMNE